MVRFRVTVTTVLASLAMINAPAAFAAQVSTPAGSDVSYPQCGEALPSSSAFAIVAVNEGLPTIRTPAWPRK